MTKVINLLGGPGIGKSTTAAEVFSIMKKKGCNVELITEYAKDLVYENRTQTFIDQLYILSKQHHKMLTRKQSGVEYLITDSPLILNIFYNSGNIYSKGLMLRAVEECRKQFINIDIFLNRNRDLAYQQEGRLHDINEALSIDKKILDYLGDGVKEIEVSDTTAKEIVEYIEQFEKVNNTK